jgi:Type II secretion system (T2SS), protein G
MTELEHSKRSLLRATYTPIRVVRPRHPSTARALDKWSYMAALAANALEMTNVIGRMTSGEQPIPPEDRPHLETLAAAVDEHPEVPSGSLPLTMLKRLGAVPPYLLVRFGAELLAVREQELDRTLSRHAAIAARYEDAMRRAAGPRSDAKPTIPAEYQLDPNFVVVGRAGANAYRFESRPVVISDAPPAASRAKRAVTRAADAITGFTAAAGTFVVFPDPVPALAPTSEQAPVGVDTLMRWAIEHDVERDAATHILALAERLTGSGAPLSVAQVRAAALAVISAHKDVNYAFGERMRIEPVGLLHLERLSFIPAGMERGELQYSVPLSPGEEVNISHKEWSNTSEEFERIVTDFIETFSEEGVTEKSELTQSTTSQQQHSSGFDLAVTASGGWGPVSISTSANFNVQDSASNSQQTARNQSNDLTRKASSRSKKEHKVSFRVASAAGTEDQAVRKIKNPFPDKTTRIDYYQLVRKWRVDLYRYGVRMTYDLTIPEPGSDVLTKIIELKAVMAALQEGFGSPTASLPWARFDLQPSQIQRWNYLALAAQYGATVEPPPADEVVIAKGFTRNWPNKDAAGDSEYTTFDIEVPESYVVRAWSANWRWWGWTTEPGFHFEIRPDLNTWIGVGGMLTLSVGTKWISTFDIQLKLWMSLMPAALDAWRQRVWGTLREAAQARYELNRTMLKDRLAQLQEELSAQDALSLRKIEREEVMKHVLRWLFGPTFTFVPPGLPPDLYGPNGAVIDAATWGKVLAHGEVIKFLHQAIEWENMLFFLYPYFWSHTTRWELKKYLDHPDFLHRVFLKSGSARVVLTIRPGFELDFVSFLETGGLNGLPDTHPYFTIAEEMRAFALTNYPGIRAANTVDNARPLLTPLQQKAWNEMQGVIALLEKHKALHGVYPTTAQGLAALAPLGTVPAADPWSTPYQYKSPGAYQDFELVSLGANGTVGGAGEEADITSWAEASLIGQWYEYTPTSALDIAFNETLPSA